MVIKAYLKATILFIVGCFLFMPLSVCATLSFPGVLSNEHGQISITLVTLAWLIPLFLIIIWIIYLFFRMLVKKIPIVRQELLLSKKMSYNRILLKKLRASARNYVLPDCQSIDPAEDNWRKHTITTRENIFNKLDAMLDFENDDYPFKYIFILADAGMGKTAFLYNYFRKALMNRKSTFFFHLLEFSTFVKGKPITAISSIDNKDRSILLLDGLDEDIQTRENCQQRLREIAELTKDFYKVIITCRSLFLPSENYFYQLPGFIDPRAPAVDISKATSFYKLFLSPLTDQQIEDYLHKKFSFWARILYFRKEFKKAKDLIQHLPKNITRPMVLKYISSLISSDKEITFTTQLYAEIVDNWLDRKAATVPEITKDELRKCCENIAQEIYQKSKERGGEYLLTEELSKILEPFALTLNDWRTKITGMLTKDTNGNIKFVHRLIMEYLIANVIIKSGTDFKIHFLSTPVITFLKEMLLIKKQEAKPLSALSSEPVKDITLFNVYTMRKLLAAQVIHRHILFGKENKWRLSDIIDVFNGEITMDVSMIDSKRFQNILSYIYKNLTEQILSIQATTSENLSKNHKTDDTVLYPLMNLNPNTLINPADLEFSSSSHNGGLALRFLSLKSIFLQGKRNITIMDFPYVKNYIPNIIEILNKHATILMEMSLMPGEINLSWSEIKIIQKELEEITNALYQSINTIFYPGLVTDCVKY